MSSVGERIWILGASDPEMEAIEALLRECGEQIAYAVDARWERVRLGQRAQAAEYDTGRLVRSLRDTTAYWVAAAAAPDSLLRESEESADTNIVVWPSAPATILEHLAIAL